MQNPHNFVFPSNPSVILSITKEFIIKVHLKKRPSAYFTMSWYLK